ncbi:molybdopterin-binding protein [Streptomyces sp. NPDC051211]|uniref:molybdopterin molybdotransferase MoeA n=1 Tax=Streptomyces sp. NPDC051211 TaxID=3154643 RepID=UPI00344EDCF7
MTSPHASRSPLPGHPAAAATAERALDEALACAARLVRPPAPVAEPTPDAAPADARGDLPGPNEATAVPEPESDPEPDDANPGLDLGLGADPEPEPTPDANPGLGLGPDPAPEPDPESDPEPEPARERAPEAAPEAAPPQLSAEQALDEALALVARNPDGGGHRAAGWARAREAAARAGAGRRVRIHRVPLAEALGEVLSEPLAALTDLPSFDTSAMDGWAVSGPGPWAMRPGEGVLAGSERPDPLADGEAVRIATGARVPADTTAVIRSEHARADEDKGRLYAERKVVSGQDIRPRGQECRSGDLLLPAGARVTPAVLGLAAAAGYDVLTTRPRPRVEILVLGDELLTEGLPHDGLIRDALSPMLGPWLGRLGAEVVATRRLGDDPEGAEELYRTLTGSTADLLITTGGTASGPVDHVHPVLSRAGAELLVDGVAVRPGHPMLLARLDEDRHLVGLPGNPLAAVSGLLTLAEPLLRGLAGLGPRPRWTAAVRGDVPGHPHDTRLVPVVLSGDHAVPLRYNGPAMLRGVAVADALAVVPQGGARTGQELEILELPWAVAAGECFT